MPTAVQLAGAAFVNPLFKPLPTIAGIQAWSYWGGSLAASQNVITAGGAYSNFGPGPTWSANYGHCVYGVSQIQTAIDGHAIAQSFLAVGRYVPGGAGAIAQFAGNGSVAPAVNAVQVQTTVAGIASPTAIALPVTTPTAFKFYAWAAGGGNACFVYNLTDNTSANGGTAGNITGAAQNYYFGGGSAGGNTQQCDIAFLAQYNAFLTKPQIDQIYAHVKDAMATRGIVC